MTRQEVIDEFMIHKKQFDQQFFKYGDPHRAMLTGYGSWNKIMFLWLKTFNIDQDYTSAMNESIISTDKLISYRHTLSMTNALGDTINCVDHEDQWHFGIEETLLEQLLNKLGF